MADVSKIKLTDNTEYDIKDAIARQNISTIDEKTDEIIEQLNNPTYTTTEGTDLTINNTRVGKMKFKYYGDTEQQTYTGVNKIGTLTDFVANDTSAINVTYNTEANTITVKHLTTAAWKGIYKTLTGLTAGATMTISVYATTTTSTGWSLSVRNSDGTVIDETTHNTSGTETHFTFTVPNDGSITIRAYAGYGDVAVNDTATYSKFQLEYGSSVTAYEPYVGGIPSPNPSYPQEIKTVTGENTIDIVGKNLFNPKNIYLGKAWNNADNTARAIAYVPLTIGNTYTISMQNVSAVDMVLYNFSDTSTLPYSIAPNQITTTTTITATKKYLYFQFNKTSVTINNILAVGIQVEKGSTASAYEAFKGQSYELNLASRNLINPNSPYLGASLGITTTYNSNGQSLNYNGTTTSTWAYLTNKINVNIPKGEYTFSINKTVSAHTVIFRMFYNETQYQDVTILVNTISRTMSITNNTIAYQIYMGGLTSGTTLNNTLNFQIEKGSQATSLEKHFEPIELCDIEGHQEYIYDNGGKWFKHKEIDKISFDGSETWTQGNPNYRYYTDKTGQANTSVIPKSNYFTGGVYAYGVIVQNFSSTVVRFNFYYDSMAGDVNAFKTWLSTNKPNVYYGLATPIEEEITEPTLINQLNAIKYGAESYYGQTNIIITSEELQPTLKVQTMDKIV